ncbi:hypothetical protein C8K15_101137 [Paenisporosarcina sp. OV554]|nr:hypothetical protein C8K15_101137 [Paenisporosarcina sp. OV554]
MVYVKRMKRYIKKMNYCTNRYSQVKEFTKELTSVRHAQSRLELPERKMEKELVLYSKDS